MEFFISHISAIFLKICFFVSFHCVYFENVRVLSLKIGYFLNFWKLILILIRS